MSDGNRDVLKSAPPGSAYLVVREGNEWRDIYPLAPGEVTTIGRAPNNRIVLRDDVCSRNHCEVFSDGSSWTLRDLGSRNGTLINGIRVEGDSILTTGQLIEIGMCELGFTQDLSYSFPQFQSKRRITPDTETAVDVRIDGLWSGSQPAILQRKRRTRYSGDGSGPAVDPDRTSQELALLYRLALEMGAARDAKQLAEVALDGIFSATSGDMGAVLLLPRATAETPQASRLHVVAFRSDAELPYEKTSDHLTKIVLAERQAILARDVNDDSRLATRDSLGAIHAKSVICAPIRAGELIQGLVHLYSTDPKRPLEPDDLEFTLAVAEQLAVALDNLKEKQSLAAGLARVQDENLTLRHQLELESELVGESRSIRDLRASITRIAPTDATVLIRGESGVGKELVARAIHFGSKRRDRPFVCLNCAALTESLLESELFGHEKGSFTGATGLKIGKFEQAHQGTLLLDEVGEMSQAVQAKFLRVLEGHPFERVGGGDPIQVDVRVVAATNRDLERAVEENAFRKDLYFRLHVVELTVDSLRERLTDVPILAEYFLRRFARKTGRLVKGFTRRALEALGQYDWPGNVRELQHTVERAVILSNGELVTRDDIHLSTLGNADAHAETDVSSAAFREVSLEVLEKEHILATLKWTNWNKSRSAQILGIERSTLDRKLKRYQMERPSS